MKFIYPNYRTGLVNKFADHIMLEIDKDNHPLTIIKVTHFTPFFVIEGSTSSKNVLDLEKVKDSFYEKNKSTLEGLGINKINTIDLIRYDVGMTDEGPIERFYDFYYSYRPMFNDKVLNYIYNHRKEWEYIDYTDKLVIGTCEMLGPPNIEYFKIVDGSRSSEFPYGYSLKMGRSSLYYSEYICNQLFPSVKANKIFFKFSNVKNDDNDYKIDIISDSPYQHEKIVSMVLDVFDFNLNKFEKKYLSNYDLSTDIDTQNSNDKPWLVKDKLDELFII